MGRVDDIPRDTNVDDLRSNDITFDVEPGVVCIADGSRTDMIADNAVDTTMEQDTVFRITHKKPDRQHIVPVGAAAEGLEQYDVAIVVHDCLTPHSSPSGEHQVRTNADPLADACLGCASVWALPTDFADLASLKDRVTRWSCDAQLEYRCQSACQMLPAHADKDLADKLIAELVDAHAFPARDSC